MKHIKVMTFVLIIIGVLLATLIISRIRLHLKFGKEVKMLFASSGIISPKLYREGLLAGLPEPVQRYFRYTLTDGQPYINYARIKHNGQFKTGFDKSWTNIQGEQYATTFIPGFIWKGSTRFFVARDMYILGEGRLIVSLFSLFKVADARSGHYNQGELLRWLGESVLYPTNLLPSDRLQWQVISAEKALLTFTYKGLNLYFTITFNKAGEITELETKRYMDTNRLETWIIKVSHYRLRNQVKVPNSFDVIWRLSKGDFSYARFNITDIEYDVAARF